jgi:hypothetical protein
VYASLEVGLYSCSIQLNPCVQLLNVLV